MWRRFAPPHRGATPVTAPCPVVFPLFTRSIRGIVPEINCYSLLTASASRSRPPFVNRFHTVVAVVAISLWMPLAWLLASITGCAQGSTGLLRPLSPSAEHALTNSIGGVAQAAPAVLPVQYSLPIQAAAAAVLALLAAWQGMTHRRLEALASKTSPPGGT